MARIFFHMGGVVLFISLYLLGKLAVQLRENIAGALSKVPVSSKHLCNFFLFSGRTFQVVGSVCAFLEVVAVMVLASGALVELLLGLSIA